MRKDVSFILLLNRYQAVLAFIPGTRDIQWIRYHIHKEHTVQWYNGLNIYLRSHPPEKRVGLVFLSSATYKSKIISLGFYILVSGVILPLKILVHTITTKLLLLKSLFYNPGKVQVVALTWNFVKSHFLLVWDYQLWSMYHIHSGANWLTLYSDLPRTIPFLPTLFSACSQI